MSKETGKLATWALTLIIAIIAWVIALGGQIFAPGNVVLAVVGIVAIVATVLGPIQYLMTKRQG